jgi:hypothetical protein
MKKGSSPNENHIERERRLPPRVKGGIAPFGYRWHQGSLVVDKAEAPVRKRIYELFIIHRRKKTAPSDYFKTASEGQQNENITDALMNTPPGIEIENIKEPSMTEAKAAKFLGISKITLLRKRHAGEIGHFRVGIRVLYSKEKHLIPFLQDRERQGKTY